MNALWRCGVWPLLPPETNDPGHWLGQAHAYVDVLTHLPNVSVEQAIRQAHSHNIPVLLFANAQLAKSLQQLDEVILYQAPDELGALIVERLSALMPLPDSSAPLSLHSPHTGHIPSLPAPYLAHPHYMARRLIGRTAELSALQVWAESTTPVLLVTGEEGIGKSTLVWHWLLEKQLNAPAQPIMLWDFAESDGGFTNFVRHALAYFSTAPLDAVSKLPRAERLPILLQVLAERSALLVLENTDHLLNVYSGFELPDAINSAETALLSPEIETFLNALPTFNALKTLLISRFVPPRYQSETGVQSLTLSALSKADAQRLLSQLVLHGQTQALEQCITALQHHPLALCLAAESGNAHLNGFNEWWQLHAATLERAQMLSERLKVLVRLVLTETSSHAQALLYNLAAQRFPVPYQMLMQQAATQARLHTILSELERRNLLLWDRATNRYALHAVIRRSVQAMWSQEERQAAFEATQRTYELLAAHVPETLQDESDLRATTELYAALVAADKAEAAVALYRERLSKPLLSRLADPQAVLRLLMPFFRQGVQRLPILESAKDEAYIAHEMALVLAALGRMTEARHLLGQTLPLFIEADDPNWLCTALVNYGSLIEDQLALRVRLFELVRKLATVTANIEDRAVANFILLHSYVEIGQWAAASEAYEEFSTSPSHYRTVSRQATAERLVAQMLLDQGQDPSGSLNLAWELAVQSNVTAEKRAIYALWGEAALSLMNRPDAAERFFEETLRMAENNTALIVYYRGGLARAYGLQGRRDEALALLEKGVPPLAAAQVYLTLGEAAWAEPVALEAYRQAWGEGLPFSHWRELEQAKAVLRELRVPLPDLPLYQPENFPKLPHEHAIRAYASSLERGKTVQAHNG